MSPGRWVGRTSQTTNQLPCPTRNQVVRLDVESTQGLTLFRSVPAVPCRRRPYLSASPLLANLVDCVSETLPLHASQQMPELPQFPADWNRRS